MSIKRWVSCLALTILSIYIAEDRGMHHGIFIILIMIYAQICEISSRLDKTGEENDE